MLGTKSFNQQFWDPIKKLPKSVSNINSTGKGLDFFNKIISDKIINTKTSSTPEVGKIYWFYYVLDDIKRYRYWDSMPLVIVTGVTNTTFTGINLHYIPNKYKMDLTYFILAQYTDSKILSNHSRVLIRPKDIEGLPNSRQLIHQYKKDNLKTDLHEVNGNSWGSAIALPLADFKVANTQAKLTPENKINWNELIHQPDISLIILQAKQKK